MGKMEYSLKGFTVAHLNIRSIRNKMDELAVIVSELCPKVLTISETWLNESVDSTIVALDGYNLYRMDRSYTRSNTLFPPRGGGLATYVLSDIAVDCHRFADLNTCTEDIEVQVLYVKSPGDKGTVIVNTYRPPSGNVPVFYDVLLGIANNLSDIRYLDQIILGDLNLDHGLTSGNVALFKSSLKSLGFTQVIDKPTRQTLNTASIIDVIYIKTVKKIVVAVIPLCISDHYMVVCSRFLDYHRPASHKIKGRTYKNYNLEAARQFYARCDTQRIFSYQDVDVVWDHLLELITSCANKLCPMKEMKVWDNKPCWITNEVIELFHERDQAFTKAQTDKLPASLTKALRLRSQCKKAARIARSEYIQTNFERNKDNAKKFWANINLHYVLVCDP